MKIENLNILATVSRQPMMLPKDATDEVVVALKRFVESDHAAEVSTEAARMSALASNYNARTEVTYRPYPVIEGVAIIPVHGILINSFGSSYGYVTGYNFIRRMADMAEADDLVTKVAFDCASTGGMVQGLFETVDAIKNMSKPTAAFVESQATSACYAIASATDQIYVAADSVIGSVGVVRVHMDYSAYMEKLGIKVTMMYRGDRKVEGNSYEPLSAEAEAAWDQELDKWYDRFTDSVAANRKMDKKAVVNTQAAVYSGEESVTIGFSDTVMTIKDGFNQFINGLNDPQSEGSKAMAKDAEQSAGNTTANTTVATTSAQAAANERQRIQGIMGCDEAKNRNTLASHLAFNTAMSVDEAKALLAVAAEEKPVAAVVEEKPVAAVVEEKPVAASAPASDSAFATAMNNGSNPNIGADAVENANTATEMTTAERILAAQKLLTGKGE